MGAHSKDTFLSRLSKLDGRVVLLLLLLGFFSLTRYCALPKRKLVLWNILGVSTITPNFFDLRAITSAWESQRLGYDPLVSNPRDPLRRLMNYPRIWLAPSSLGLDQSHTAIIGVWMAALFYVCVFLFVGELKTSHGVLYAVIICSPAVLLAVERGNNDLVIFALLAIGVCMVRYRRKLSPILYILVLAAAMLKLFPIFALTCVVREKPKRALITICLVAGAFVAYLLYTLHDIYVIGQAIGQNENLYPSYGSMIVFQYVTIKASLSGQGPSRLFLRYISLTCLLACLGLAYAWARSKKPDLPETEHSDAFRIGASIYLGTFVLGNSYDYRLIFLIFALPQLLSWMRVRNRLGTFSKVLVASVVFSVWSMIFPETNPLMFILKELVRWFIFASLPAWLRNRLFLIRATKVRRDPRQTLPN
jgi:hypothetical protein